MVHILPDAQGRIRLPKDRKRMNTGCYNFSIDSTVTMTPEAADPITVDPLCQVSVPDQVRVDFLGTGGHRNFWVTGYAEGDTV